MKSEQEISCLGLFSRRLPVARKELLQIVQVTKCHEPWWITLMINRVFWVTAVKSGHGGTKCNMATTCPCRNHCSEVKATQALRVNTPDKALPRWLNAKSPCESFLPRRWLPAAAVSSNHVAVCTTLFLKRSNRVRLFSRHLHPPHPCCFIHRAQGSFAKSSVVDLRRQTALQIRQNSVRLNDILHRRLANRKENSGGSALKPRVSGRISHSVSRRDPLKCLLSSWGSPEGTLLSFTHSHKHTCMHAFTLKHSPRDLMER